jgi:hypothetical protein
MLELEPEATEVRRLEVITGTGRRRKFAADFKARVVEETLRSLYELIIRLMLSFASKASNSTLLLLGSE